MPSKILLWDLWAQDATLTLSQDQLLVHSAHHLDVVNICEKLFENPSSDCRVRVHIKYCYVTSAPLMQSSPEVKDWCTAHHFYVVNIWKSLQGLVSNWVYTKTAMWLLSLWSDLDLAPRPITLGLCTSSQCSKHCCQVIWKSLQRLMGYAADMNSWWKDRQTHTQHGGRHDYWEIKSTLVYFHLLQICKQKKTKKN